MVLTLENERMVAGQTKMTLVHQRHETLMVQLKKLSLKEVKCLVPDCTTETQQMRNFTQVGLTLYSALIPQNCCENSGNSSLLREQKGTGEEMIRKEIWFCGVTNVKKSLFFFFFDWINLQWTHIAGQRCWKSRSLYRRHLHWRDLASMSSEQHYLSVCSKPFPISLMFGKYCCILPNTAELRGHYCEHRQALSFHRVTSERRGVL